MIRRDIKSPRRGQPRDRQIAEPRGLPHSVAEAVAFAGQMARLVIDEEELRTTHIGLRDPLAEAVDPFAVKFSLGLELRAVVRYHFSDKSGFFI